MITKSLKLYDGPTITRFTKAIQASQSLAYFQEMLEPIGYKIFPDSVEFECRVLGRSTDTAQGWRDGQRRERRKK
ncbi:MAG: hypothetical protein CMJ20_01790 [Phycisphaeraceae bacterium]|nr:hypothetical protein [Phycisphaeraceae bacterium]